MLMLCGPDSQLVQIGIVQFEPMGTVLFCTRSGAGPISVAMHDPTVFPRFTQFTLHVD